MPFRSIIANAQSVPGAHGRVYIFTCLLVDQAPIAQEGSNVTHVCVGAEWHRFPSAFFLPSPAYRLAFIPSSFSGLLPADFDVTKVPLLLQPLLNYSFAASKTDASWLSTRASAAS